MNLDPIKQKELMRVLNTYYSDFKGKGFKELQNADVILKEAEELKND